MVSQKYLVQMRHPEPLNKNRALVFNIIEQAVTRIHRVPFNQ